MEPYVSLYEALIEEVDSINTCFSRNLSSKGFDDNFFLEEINQDILRNCNELTFIYVVAFLYKLYVERGKSNVLYLLKKFNIFNIDKIECENHLEIIHDFRTFLFHFLDTKQEHNKKIIKKCKMWFLGQIGNDLPTNEKEWEKCVLSLLQDSKKSLETLKDCLEKLIELNDDDVLDEWLRYTKKDIPKHKIREIVIEIAAKYELNYNIDVFLEKNFNKIKEKISFFNMEQIASIEYNTKLIIENLIFQSGNLVCPLSGDDIEKIFGVTGKELGKIKQKAIQIFNSNIYFTKEEIIDDLKNN